MKTIVFCHPWHGSFNKAILDTITMNFDNDNIAYQVIDLCKDNFRGDFTEEELAVYNKGEYKDPLVGKYQEMIKKTDEIIFIFPIWWSLMPANLKGFFDKVFLVNFSHNYVGGWNSLLKIDKTTVITTSESPTENYKNVIENVFIKGMLAPLGINNAKWFNNPSTSHGTEENRKNFLKMIKDYFK